MSFNFGILTVSDGCAQGRREDLSGPIMADMLTASGFKVTERRIVSDDHGAIDQLLRSWCDHGLDVVITTGGTGLSPRDVTPEVTRRLIEREAPGIAELLRWTGYQRNPRAALSRGVAGVRGATLIINLPGSPSAVREGLDALIPLLPHAVAILRDEPVDHTLSTESSSTPTESNEPVTSVEDAPREPALAAPHACVIPGDGSLTGASDQTDAGTAVDSVFATPGPVDVIETNIDDLSPELYEFVIGRLFAAGALDVFLTPIQMKKSRPGTLITVIAAPESTEHLATILFRESSTFGVRHTRWQRYTLDRRWVDVETCYGTIRIKVGSRNGADASFSPEYEDVKAAAQRHDAPAKAVYTAAIQAYGSRLTS